MRPPLSTWITRTNTNLRMLFSSQQCGSEVWWSYTARRNGGAASLEKHHSCSFHPARVLLQDFFFFTPFPFEMPSAVWPVRRTRGACTQQRTVTMP
ncbi:hypothetical protein E2C01_085071 [Portunus trituberculatus]|uniref:Uncharacterized protein n=1 Tax=Portunus trituberculatus TaxID=210409 RepID=A0A5B7J6G4_PORTR|nr:hypothetical protein [Portunus trituberculatus]